MSEGEESLKLKLVRKKKHIACDVITVVVVTLAAYAAWTIAAVSLDSGFMKMFSRSPASLSTWAANSLQTRLYFVLPLHTSFFVY